MTSNSPRSICPRPSSISFNTSGSIEISNVSRYSAVYCPRDAIDPNAAPVSVLFSRPLRRPTSRSSSMDFSSFRSCGICAWINSSVRTPSGSSEMAFRVALSALRSRLDFHSPLTSPHNPNCFFTASLARSSAAIVSWKRICHWSRVSCPLGIAGLILVTTPFHLHFQSRTVVDLSSLNVIV